jgi:hypothetical protein
MQGSHCTSGQVNDATASCEKANLSRFKAAISCWCTDDKSYISTRCG